MRTIHIPVSGLIPAAILVMALGAPAAFAQSASPATAPMPPSASSAPSAAAQPSVSDPKMAPRIKIEHSLQQAGFKNVQVLKESFLVQAQAADGTTVVMVINPPSQSAAMSGDNSANGSGSSATPGVASSANANPALTPAQPTSN